MYKDVLQHAEKFLHWAAKKIRIHFDEREVFFFEQEIWWAALGENVGSEENGKNQNFERPILIIRKLSRNIFWAVPITTKIRMGSWYHTWTSSNGERCLILAQLRVMSSKRLLRRVGRLEDAEFCTIRTKIISLLNTKAEPPNSVGGSSNPPYGGNVKSD